MTKTLDELIQRLELIAAWRKRGGDTPSEEMPDTYQACIDAVSALRELIADAERLEGGEFANEVPEKTWCMASLKEFNQAHDFLRETRKARAARKG